MTISSRAERIDYAAHVLMLVSHGLTTWAMCVQQAEALDRAGLLVGRPKPKESDE